MSCLMHSVSITHSNRLEICTIVFRFLNVAAEQQTLITNTMRRIEQETAINNRQCVRFRPKVSTDEYSILIRTGVGCSSHVCRYHFDIWTTKHRCPIKKPSHSVGKFSISAVYNLYLRRKYSKRKMNQFILSWKRMPCDYRFSGWTKYRLVWSTDIDTSSSNVAIWFTLHAWRSYHSRINTHIRYTFLF